MITTLGQIKQNQLLQNYPNPFNPETWIPYQLASDSNVVIRIFGLSGATVRVLDVGRKKSGIYMSQNAAAYWDGRNNNGQSVASGIYFYQLETGDTHTNIKKMVIAR